MDNSANSKPKMYILAGPNGSGKSSVLLGIIPDDIPFFNADRFSREKAKELGATTEKEIQNMVNNSDTVKLAGMRKVKEKMMSSISKKESFITETTLKGYERTIKSAKEQGFEVELWYVGTESSDINVFRVSDRVSKGGHDVPTELIVKRYDESLKNLSSYIKIVDKAEIYDNSEYPRHILTIEHDKIAERNDPIPDWVNENVLMKLPRENIEPPYPPLILRRRSASNDSDDRGR